MFKLEDNPEVLGAHLEKLIKSKYKNTRQFCKAYLELRDGTTNDEEIRKLLNRMLQILKGKKRIQVEDLPCVSELLDVSCEEILSAGKTHSPVISHMTNYDIAFSNDRSVWEKYMKREDKLFLNCDEYNKSVIDYALEFKNYAFIKYLLDEKFIWFVDLDGWKDMGFTFGAGTSVKRRDIGSIDTTTPIEIQTQDRLRTSTIALAIENNDFVILDSLCARMIPEMLSTNFFYTRNNYQRKKNQELLNAIANSENDAVLDYFSDEFSVKSLKKYNNKYVFPFLGDVIDIMLENGKYKKAEILVRKAIRHNKSVFQKLKTLINDAYEFNKSHLGFNPEGVENILKNQTLNNFSYDDINNLVSYFYFPENGQTVGIVSNIVHVKSNKADSLLRELILELNTTYDDIVAIRGDK